MFTFIEMLASVFVFCVKVLDRILNIIGLTRLAKSNKAIKYLKARQYELESANTQLSELKMQLDKETERHLNCRVELRQALEREKALSNRLLDAEERGKERKNEFNELTQELEAAESTIAKWVERFKSIKLTTSGISNELRKIDNEIASLEAIRNSEYIRKMNSRV